MPEGKRRRGKLRIGNGKGKREGGVGIGVAGGRGGSWVGECRAGDGVFTVVFRTLYAGGGVIGGGLIYR